MISLAAHSIFQTSMKEFLAIHNSVYGVVALATALAIGCGTNGTDLVPVHGLVSLDGLPLPRGTISFIPDSGSSATSPINSDGTFQLRTQGKFDGAAPGRYRVAIVALDGPLVEDGAAKSLIPKHYGDPASSTLEYNVKSGIDNEAKFDLSSKPKSAS